MTSLILCEYITDKLIKNIYSFGFFAVGVLLGILLILLVYKVFTKTQAKPLKLKKTFDEEDLLNDDIEKNAVADIKALDTRQAIDVYTFKSVNILVQALKDIAKIYTGNKHMIELNLEGLKEKYPFLSLTFDTDITIENALKFIAESGEIIEKTLLDTIDSHSALSYAFLKFLGFKGNIRDITVKDVIIYLNKQSEKKNKKIEKKEEKLQKENEKLEAKKIKQLEKERQEKEKEKLLSKKSHRKKKNKESDNKFLTFFKKKPKEEKTKKEKPKKEKPKKEKKEEREEKQELSSFLKPVNKVLREIFIKLTFSLGGEVKRLYGDGFRDTDAEEKQKIIEEKGIEEALKNVEDDFEEVEE